MLIVVADGALFVVTFAVRVVLPPHWLVIVTVTVDVPLTLDGHVTVAFLPEPEIVALPLTAHE
jgi:hypothetical protein